MLVLVLALVVGAVLALALALAPACIVAEAHPLQALPYDMQSFSNLLNQFTQACPSFRPPYYTTSLAPTLTLAVTLTIYPATTLPRISDESHAAAGRISEHLGRHSEALWQP